MILVVGVGLVCGCLYSAWYISNLEEIFSGIPVIESTPGLLADSGDPKVDPRNILIIGTTETHGLDPNDASLAFRASESYTDTMILLRLDPILAQASVLSIPRDLWVSIGGTQSRINSAYGWGGPNLLVDTVKKTLNVEVHDFVVVNFAGFRKLVDEIGGVPVYFPNPARDLKSFFEVPTAGCHVLNGEQALNYVRARSYEEKIDGSWRADNRNDYGRTERQRDFLILALERLSSRGGRNPSTMRRLLNTAIDNDAVVLDDKLTPKDLLDIGKAFGDFRPEYLQRFLLPVSGYVTNGGASVVGLVDDEAAPILDVFRGLGNTVQPDQIKVRVTDNRGPVSEPTPPSRLLTDAGFRISTAPKAQIAPGRTTIQFTSDQRNAAIVLARHLTTTPAFQQIIGDRNLTLVVSTDFQGLRPIPADEAEITALIDQSLVASSVSAPPATTNTSNANAPTNAPVTTAPPSGIIGLAPSGVACS
jgi:LCP family protein required for cell wall assembly